MSSYVLVHGAFEGGWCWRDVASELRAAGHTVYTPSLAGCGERQHLLQRDISLETHRQDLLELFRLYDIEDAILVGHSYGGAVITAVADALNDRIAHLVYLDSAAPENGQSSSGAFTEGTEDKLAEMSGGDDWLLPPLPMEVLGLTAPEHQAWVEPKRQSHPMRTLNEPVSCTPDDWTFSVTYVCHTDKEAMVKLFGVDPLATFVERAKREGWRYEEIAAGHDAMITHPSEVSAVLLSLGS